MEIRGAVGGEGMGGRVNIVLLLERGGGYVMLVRTVFLIFSLYIVLCALLLC